MKCKTGKDTIDKIRFVFYSMTSGVIFWIISLFIISWQQYVIEHYINHYISLLLYLVPYLVFLWYISINRKKNQWKPFSKHSNVIAVIIILAEFSILFFALGYVQISF